MEFDDHHKVKIETLAREEAVGFLEFLDIEKDRHWEEVDYANQMATRMPYIANIWKSASYRHSGDVDDIQKLILKVKEMFKL